MLKTANFCNRMLINLTDIKPCIASFCLVVSEREVVARLPNQYHPIAPYLVRINPQSSPSKIQNCLIECNWLLFHQMYFHVRNSTSISLNKISL